MSINTLLAHVKKVQKSGSGAWMCLCPSHDDTSRSLKITQAEEGKVLIHCFAGCSPAEILGAVGLRMEDLFDDPNFHHKESKPRIYPREVMKAMIPELMLFLLASMTLKKGKALEPVDQERLQVSYDRLMYALELAEIE